MSFDRRERRTPRPPKQAESGKRDEGAATAAVKRETTFR
jgi:hypothetical protein